MRIIFLWILAGLVIWPISSTVATFKDKPIDLILSDMLFVVLPLLYVGIKSTPTPEQLNLASPRRRWYRLPPYCALVCILYMTSLAGIGLGMTEEWVRIYSAFKLAKPIGFVILGLLIGGWTDPFELIDVMGRAFGALVTLSLFYTLTDPSFPFGEWGKYIYEWELGGYPNAPMSFYAVMTPLLFATADTTKSPQLRVLFWGLASGCALMIVGSMSRSSALALLVGTVYYLARTGRGSILIGTAAFVSLSSIIGIGLFSAVQDTEFYSVLSDRVRMRIERSTEQDDPSSGRFEIWQLAVELAIEKPTFGYLFESFSRYSGIYDTPHQQYLEVLYKCGGVGLLLYLTLLTTCWLAARRLQVLTPRGSAPWYRLHGVTAMLIGVLVGNLTQPNLTYSLIGNMVFLVFGCLCSERAVLSALKPTISVAKTLIQSRFAPVRRIAA